LLFRLTSIGCFSYRSVEVKRPLPLIFLALFLFAHSQQAMAQRLPNAEELGKTYRGILFRCLQTKWPDVRLDKSHPDRAYIPETQQNVAWDNEKKAWIDTKTGKSVGPFKTMRGALFACCLQDKWPDVRLDKSHPDRAYIPETQQNVAWDKEKEAWVDTKTGECVCPKCPPSRTAQQPTPSTTDKVTGVLKTIGSSVSIGIGGGIGGGGGDRHGHHGEGGHRTAEKVRTGDKSRTTSTTSKKTTTGTGHKTVTAACKCHPCTCAPCTCH
jgi:hypothetical protein